MTLYMYVHCTVRITRPLISICSTQNVTCTEDYSWLSQ